MCDNGLPHVKVALKNKFFPVNSHCLRWSSDEVASVDNFVPAGAAASAAGVLVVEVASPQPPSRERGTYDDAAKKHALSIFESLGGMERMLQKWTDSWPSQERRAELKTQLFKIFPKDPTPGVCYVPFHSPHACGKSVVKGNLHPRARPHNVAIGIQIILRSMHESVMRMVVYVEYVTAIVLLGQDHVEF